MVLSRKISLIGGLSILTAYVHVGYGSGDESVDHGRAGNDYYPPPKLSFTAETLVKKNDEITSSSVWGTIFQGVDDKSKVDSVRLRSGPLLTLFFNDESIGSEYNARHVVLDPTGQRSYLADKGADCHPNIVDRFDQFQSASLNNLATELWKYCALYLEGGVYVDAETAPLVAMGDVLKSSDSTEKSNNYAVVVDTTDAAVSPQFWPTSLSTDADGKDDVDTSDNEVTTSFSGSGISGNKIVSGSFIAIQSKLHSVPKTAIDTIMNTPIDALERNALLLPKTLMAAIKSGASKGKDSWTFLNQRCHGIQTASGDGGNQNQQQQRSLRHCPSSSGYCCEIFDAERSFVFLLSRHPLVPNQILPHPSTLPQPYAKTINAAVELDPKTLSELPFISTISEDKSSDLLTEPFQRGSTKKTPNVYDLLHAKEALPNQEDYPRQCMDCLRIKSGANCNTCEDVCPTFCEHLCSVKLKEKPVKRVLTISEPRFRKDPERIIPRIIHQTWFEPVTAEKYPNMARLIESWKRSGWEYNFYDDDAAGEFLSLHFPPEVKEAYDSILPGAFKADLFRYCVLLIKGGVYSDMDIILESNLDAAVPPDVGFMTPVDEPGTKHDHRMCLWNGMIAAAPAHPYLARVIDNVVHNIRNRFTVVDYDYIMCKNPELSVPHAYSTLFTGGPCILGLTLNEVMGRPLQQTFEHGDLKTDVEVPGRTVILDQNKWDMGAHRFTWVDNNLVVAATDMPDYDDRKELKGEDKDQTVHYSKTLDRTNLYGYTKVYVDREIAHERIVFQLESDQKSDATA